MKLILTRIKLVGKSAIWLSLLGMSVPVFGQVRQLTLHQAIEEGSKNNKELTVSAMQADLQQQLKKAGFEIPKTDVNLIVGQFNSISREDNNISVTQTIPFPTVYTANAALGDAKILESRLQTAMDRNELTSQIRQTYFYLQFLRGTEQILKQQDSLFNNIGAISGKNAALDQAITSMQSQEIDNRLVQNRAEQKQYLLKLQVLTGSHTAVDIAEGRLTEQYFLAAGEAAIAENPQLTWMQQQIETAEKQRKLEIAKALPDIRAGYFNQTLIGMQNIDGQDTYFGAGERFQGVQVGVSIPLFFNSYVAKVRSAEISARIAESRSEAFREKLLADYRQAAEEYVASKANLDYYNLTAIPGAAKLAAASRDAYLAGNIRYADHIQNLRMVSETKEKQQTALLRYDLSVARMMYLTGQ